MLIIPQRYLQNLVSCPQPAVLGGSPFLINLVDNDGPLQRETTTQSIKKIQERKEGV